MKSSEAKPLSPEELTTLGNLLERWVLTSYPYYDGSSEASDAYQVYYSIDRDVKKGKQRHLPKNEEEVEEMKRRMKEYGETEFD